MQLALACALLVLCSISTTARSEDVEAQLDLWPKPVTATPVSVGRANSTTTGATTVKHSRSFGRRAFHFPTFPSCYKKGLTRWRPAKSCEDVYKCNPRARSGFYWLKSRFGRVKRIKCTMGSLCGIKGGWMLVTSINARKRCPRSMKRVNANGR